MSRKEYRAEMRRKHGPDWWKHLRPESLANPRKRRTNRRRYFTSERQELIHLLYDHGYGRDIEGAQRFYERLRRKGLSPSGIREWVDQEYREGRVTRFGSTPRYNRR